MTSRSGSSLWNQLLPRKSQKTSFSRRRLFLEPLESRRLLASYNAADDFSVIENPHEVWTYGSTQTLGAAFTVYDTAYQYPDAPGVDYWGPSPQEYPQVAHNGTTSGIGDQVHWNPGEMTFHPGFHGEYSVVRWTAPSTGNVSIRGGFVGKDFWHTTTDVHILQNGTSFFDGIVRGFGPGTGPSVTETRHVDAGDTIDFAVGMNNGVNYNDTTGLEAVITFLSVGVRPVSPDPRTTPVDTIDVDFEGAIEPATFTRDDVTLTRDGGANLITSAVTITKVDDTHYRIGGLTSLTNDLGMYQIVVNGNTISKAAGGAVGEFAIDNWRRKAPPSVVDIVDVSPDPRETGVSSIDVTFSEPIQLSTFNQFDLRLTRDGGGNLITSAVTTSFVSGSTYRINNLFSLTETPGTYRLVVSGNFTDNFNITAASSATETWINNLPPKLALGGSTTFIENGRPQLLVRGALVSDPDDAVLAWGNLNVAITANAASGDRLRVQNQGTGAGQISVTPDRIIRYEGVVIGRYSGGVAADPLIVTLNDSASLPAVQALVRAVTFANFDSNPPTELRTVQFLLDDGDGGVSLPQFKYVNVQRNGGLPQIAMGGEPAYRENAAPLVVSPFAGFQDADSPNFDGGKLTVAIVQNAAADDRLAVRDQGTAAGEIGLSGNDVTFGGVAIGTLSGGMGAAPLEVALNVSATRAAVQALIRNVTFATLGDRPDTSLRTLSFVLNDGDGGINSPVLKNVKVLAVNDAVVIAADGGPVGYVNNDPAGVLFAATAAVLDPDSANFNGGQLTVSVIRGAVAANRLEIGGGFTLSSGKVLLGSTVIGRLTGSGVGFDSLVINFTNQATRSIVEQLVRSLRFRSVNAAHTFDRTIAITVLDTPHGFGSTALVKVAVSP